MGNNTVANNLVYGNGHGVSMKVGAATGTIAADPLFVSYSSTGSGNYRLQTGTTLATRATAVAARGFFSPGAYAE